MRRYPLVWLCCVVIAYSCFSSKPKPTDTAESKATYGTLQLGLPGTVKGTVEPTTVFLTSDPSIVALVELEELKGEIEARWDWIAPNDTSAGAAGRLASRDGRHSRAIRWSRGQGGPGTTFG